ncbi:Gfo/Idh/MocA family oxidoreductase [Actinocrinis puniceicyclus]|uniref:Gfo/Idh/MocA family oxidoreductase n=1 Tax=Actinocrinis puniceicyclus TaxID=977794 RepID=A0A8J7WUD5_9ACTN|nr:Gfo/Idh/MocA family oxidoreductase [Actinocrinis puniceicyclus]MBS2966152.1 Gfo/Idh/MocA family oxidoreductase [Actinocrinis puniceicyclus]
MTGAPVGVAIVGAGVISGAYLKNLTAFPDVRVLAIADLDAERAAAVAAQHGVPVSGGLEAVLAVPEVEVVVNLTTPAAHTAVAHAALNAGKHVYGEKPLALDPASGARLLAEAQAAGLRVGNAPDTFLGAGIQSSLRALRSGVIGQPVAVTTVIQNAGPESWHPNPQFLFQAGAGPLYDIGPYYLTALTALLGPAARVAASARRARAQRVIGSGPLAGTVFDVEVPTHVTALIDLAGGPSVASTYSFDSPVRRRMIEITGTEGTLSVPDPNTFTGPVLVRGPKDEDWRELPVRGPVAGRGLGVLDLARALRADEPHRACGQLAQHVLETMAAIADSAAAGEFRQVPGGVPAPAPLPDDWDPYASTLA